MTLIVHTDGGSRGNPGPAAAAFIITDSTGKLIKQSGSYLGVTTNNQAEYQAVLLALNWISQNIENQFQNSINVLGGASGAPIERPQPVKRMGEDVGWGAAKRQDPNRKMSFETGSITFYLDSELVARQLSGQYKIKSQDLLPLAIKIRNLIPQLSVPVRFFSIPRGQNRAADGLVNQVLDSQV